MLSELKENTKLSGKRYVIKNIKIIEMNQIKSGAEKYN